MDTSRLKVGDLVIVNLSMHRYYVGEVIRITTKGLLRVKTFDGDDAGTLFAKNGDEVGGNKYNPARLEEATPERVKTVREENEKSEMIRYLKCYDWVHADLGKLKNAYKAVKG